MEQHAGMLTAFKPSPNNPWSYGVNGNGLDFQSELATSVDTGEWSQGRWRHLRRALHISVVILYRKHTGSCTSDPTAHGE